MRSLESFNRSANVEHRVTIDRQAVMYSTSFDTAGECPGCNECAPKGPFKYEPIRAWQPLLHHEYIPMHVRRCPAPAKAESLSFFSYLRELFR
jgi:hypothetical protein